MYISQFLNHNHNKNSPNPLQPSTMTKLANSGTNTCKSDPTVQRIEYPASLPRKRSLNNDDRFPSSLSNVSMMSSFPISSNIFLDKVYFHLFNLLAILADVHAAPPLHNYWRAPSIALGANPWAGRIHVPAARGAGHRSCHLRV